MAICFYAISRHPDEKPLFVILITGRNLRKWILLPKTQTAAAENNPADRCVAEAIHRFFQ